VIKVYCSECRHYSATDHYNVCAIVDSKKANWHSRYTTTFEPETQNEVNDCKYWEHTRGLIEWLKDILNRL
jgi:hypothetical protein